MASDRYRISRAQIEALPPTTAFEAVRRYHRDWLTGRSATATTPTGRMNPEVFLDGRHYGPLDVLHQIGTEAIEEIRFIAPADATTRFGTGYPAGIIEIVSRRDSPF